MAPRRRRRMSAVLLAPLMALGLMAGAIVPASAQPDSGAGVDSVTAPAPEGTGGAEAAGVEMAAEEPDLAVESGVTEGAATVRSRVAAPRRPVEIESIFQAPPTVNVSYTRVTDNKTGQRYIAWGSVLTAMVRTHSVPQAQRYMVKWFCDDVAISDFSEDMTFTLTEEHGGCSIKVLLQAQHDRIQPANDELTMTYSVSPGRYTAWPVPQLQTSIPLMVGVEMTVHAFLDYWGWEPMAPERAEYQWYCDGAAIAGATGETYTPTPDDVGCRFTADVTYIRDRFQRKTATTAPTAQLEWLDWTATPEPEVYGKVAFGQELIGMSGTWIPSVDSMKYEWKSGGVTVGNGHRYVVQAADMGRPLTVTVTGSALGRPDVTRTSAPVTPTDWGQIRVQAPAIEGTARHGSTLRALPGTVTPGGLTSTFAWYRDDQPISGATDQTYELGADDLGARIHVVQSVEGQPGTVVGAASEKTAPVEAQTFTQTSTPTLDRRPLAGREVILDVGEWAPVTPEFAYQWKLDGAPIAGATGATYVPTRDQVGGQLTATVTARAAGYQTVERTTVPWRIQAHFVLPSDDVYPTITGSPTVGSTLTAQPGVWTPQPDTVSWQWIRWNDPIPGATDISYTLTPEDAGALVTVKMIVDKAHYDQEFAHARNHQEVTLPSGQTLPEPPTPRITGDQRVGQTVTAVAGTWPEDPTLFYQWYVGGQPVKGATSKDLTLSAEMLSSQLQVEVSGYKAGFNPAKAMSAQTSNVGLVVGQRLSGTDRYKTAVEVSRSGHTTGQGGTVVIATGVNFPDALSAAPLAALREGPMLLTERDALPAVTRDEILRIAPDQILVVGGTGAVADSVLEELGSLGATDVRRLSGKSRYLTSIAIAEEGWGDTGSSGGAFIATGNHFADALAAGAAAGARGMPVLLVDGRAQEADDTIRQAIKDLDVERAYIAGGGGVVSEGIAGTLDVPAVRYSGTDRYATAAAIADAFPAGQYGTAYLATGEGYADALGGAALAGQQNGSLLLSKKACVPAAAHAHMVGVAKPATIRVIGGSVALSDAVLRTAVCGS